MREAKKGKMLRRTLTMRPGRRGIKDDRLIRLRPLGDVAIPDVPMQQARLNLLLPLTPVASATGEEFLLLNL